MSTILKSRVSQAIISNPKTLEKAINKGTFARLAKNTSLHYSNENSSKVWMEQGFFNMVNFTDKAIKATQSYKAIKHHENPQDLIKLLKSFIKSNNESGIVAVARAYTKNISKFS